MATIKKRLQAQPQPPRRGVDRSLVFVIGELTDAERRKLRGVVFPARSKVDAQRRFDELLKMAKEAVATNTVPEFLDALDQRTRRTEWGPSFEAFADEWERTCVDGAGLRESSAKSDKQILRNHLKPYFGSLPLSDIDVRRVDQFKAAMRKKKHQYGVGLSAKSINNSLSVLHRIFEKAIEYGHIEKNPVTKKSWLKPETTPEDSRPWWTPTEEAKALATLEQWRETEPLRRIIIVVQLITGIRFAELRALRKEDLDLQAPGLWIRRSQARTKVSTPKNKRARFQAIPRALADELKVWMLSTEGQLLFPSFKGGPLPNNTLNRSLAKLAEEAGVRRITSHGLRHTAGTSYAAMGAGNKRIAVLLGHADMKSTERYTHAVSDGISDLVEARWEKLKGEGGRRDG
ncbi:MAG: tyrosine-type recombinase/integrase [Myxococcales bacterium]|nr:tyrosine-type recombinase/integrase [Myxococcales bacterium]